MTEIEKKDDAGARAPKGEAKKADTGSQTRKPDAPSDDEDTDGGRIIPLDKINSANDE